MTTPTAEIELKKEIILQLWMHQSNLFWSRIQTAIAIQGAIIGAWYLLFKDNGPLKPLSHFVLLGGVSLSIGLILIMSRDKEYLDKFSTSAIWENKEINPGVAKGVGGANCGVLMVVFATLAITALLVYSVIHR